MAEQHKLWTAADSKRAEEVIGELRTCRTFNYPDVMEDAATLLSSALAEIARLKGELKASDEVLLHYVHIPEAVSSATLFRACHERIAKDYVSVLDGARARSSAGG